MATIPKATRDLIVAQCTREIEFARQHKRGKISNWKKNEDMYYGKKKQADDSRANIELGKMQGFVHTILSKIDSPLKFKFSKGSEADLISAKRANALADRDGNVDDWDYKDLLGKKQGVIYGRAIYSYFAESKPYRSNLTNVDVYDFLIDPAGGGYDIEKAKYLGNYGVVLTRQQLKKGIKDGKYLKQETNLLLEGDGNSEDRPQEETDKDNRYQQFASTRNREIGDKDKFKFWSWYTTFEGERYYVVFTESGNSAIRVTPLEDMFSEDERTGTYLWPYWTWSAFPDLTEFWTPSYCDYVREVFMAQNVSINQMLDNAEEYNKPQRAVDVSKIKSLSDVKYKKNGIIKMVGTEDINRHIQVLRPQAIDTPIRVYEMLEGIQQIESGVTGSQKGIADEDKVGIYEGNLAAVADRFNLLNKSYSHGYKKFARLYLRGIYDHLTTKVAIRIIGIDGIKTEEITKKDIDPYSDYDILVQSSSSESQSDVTSKRNKLAVLSAYRGIPTINQHALFEMEAEIAGFEYDDIKRLLEVENTASAELMSEAARDIERILGKEDVEPNEAANTAYAQYILDYVRDNKEHMKDEVFNAFMDYLVQLEPIIIRNMVRLGQETIAKETGAQLQAANAEANAALEPPVEVATPEPQELPV